MSGRRGESAVPGPRKDRDHAEDRPGGAHAESAEPAASPGMPLFLRQAGERAAGSGSPSFTPAGLRVQRAPADGAASPPPASASPSPAGPDPAAADPAADAKTPVPGLIVDDATVDLAPGQMRRSDFLALLRGEVCTAAEQALAGTLWSSVGCPYIDRWFGHYAGQSAEHVERALRRYVPEAAGAPTAAGYVPLVAARVRSAVAQWAGGEGGEAPEAPAGDEAPSGGGLLSAVAGFFFKGKEGGARADSSPLAVRAKLGRGSALEGGIGARMGAALGRDFSRVRVHTDARAGSLSEGMNARAFTVGDHVAFAPGEYRPGTPVGDALIAHELAHVAQQGGGSSSSPASGSDGAYEEEADRAAVGAVGRIWGGLTGGLASIGAGALPAMRSGLRLQRCGGKKKEPSLVETLGKIDDPHSLAGELTGLTAEVLTDLSAKAPAGSLLKAGVDWERAMRGKKWATVAALARAGSRGLHEHHLDAVVAAIMAGETVIQVDAADPSFVKFVRTHFHELGSKPTGFRLIVELLAAGQPVTMAPTTGGATTDRTGTGPEDQGGRFTVYDADGNLLPPDQQKKGAPAGSKILLNPAIAENQVTVGGTAAAPTLIDADATVTFGHELIHALHNARGQNIAPTVNPQLLRGLNSYKLVKDPVTGEAMSAEELLTITGARKFQKPDEYKGGVDWPLEYNIPDADVISENDLRRERGLPLRASHLGGMSGYTVPVTKGETLERMLGRYYLEGGGAISAPLMATIRSLFLEWNPLYRDKAEAPIDYSPRFPHGDYISVHLQAVAKNAELAEVARKLRVRGGT